MKPITLPKPITISQPEQRRFGTVVSEASEHQYTSITLREVVDSPGQRTVTARLLENLPEITLWQGDEYDEVGDWTQEQAEARLLEILESESQ